MLLILPWDQSLHHPRGDSVLRLRDHDGGGGLILVWSAVLYAQDPVSLYQGFPAEVSPFAAIAVMVAFAPWAFVGFDNVPQAAGEFDFSPKKAMGLIVAAIFASGAIYLAMLLVTSVAASHAGGSFDGSVWATADAITAMLGPVGRALVVIAEFTGVITGLNGFTVPASRILMTMGRARMLPPVLGRVSHRLAPRWWRWPRRS